VGISRCGINVAAWESKDDDKWRRLRADETSRLPPPRKTWSTLWKICPHVVCVDVTMGPPLVTMHGKAPYVAGRPRGARHGVEPRRIEKVL
jgi:hypothetical protein